MVLIKKIHIIEYEVPKMEMYLTLGNMGNEKPEARIPNELQPISYSTVILHQNKGTEGNWYWEDISEINYKR